MSLQQDFRGYQQRAFDEWKLSKHFVRCDAVVQYSLNGFATSNDPRLHVKKVLSYIAE